MKTHELKCHPHFFAAIAAGKKTFEIRRNDRDYRVGDVLDLRDHLFGRVFLGAFLRPPSVSKADFRKDHF